MLFFSWAALSAETTFSGFVSAETHQYFEELSEPTRRSDNIMYLQPELDIKYNKRSRMHFKPVLRFNSSTEEKPEQVFLNVQEAYWDLKFKSLRIKLGQNIYNWGVLDGYSTLDVVNGRAMFNPLQSDKRGAPTVDIQYEANWFQVQALYIPVQARTLFPSTDSRWLPREVIFNTQGATAEPIEFLLPDTFNYNYPSRTELDDALKNNFGLRLTSRWNDFDMALSAFEGASTVPQIALLATGTAISLPPDPTVVQGNSDVGIIPIYFRQRSVGGSLVWAPSDVIFKIETNYIDSLSESPIIPPWSWQNGIGIERPWNIGSTSLTTILQVYYGENEDPQDNLLSSSGRLFDRAAIVGARLAWSADTTFLVSYLYDYDGGASYIRSSVDSKLTDSIKWELAGDFIDGDPDTFLGTYSKNDRVIFKLSYLW